MNTMPASLPDVLGAVPQANPLHAQRKAQLPALTTGAHIWLASLPPQYQPLSTAHRHPHIVNRMSELWATPGELPEYFSELMLSRRPGREGFTFEVLTELADLQAMLDIIPREGGLPLP